MNNATQRKKNSLVAGIVSYSKLAVSILTGILLVPVYVAYTGADGFGVWLASGNLLAWMVVMDPGIAELSRQRVSQFYGAGKWPEVCSTICSSLLVIGLIAAAIVIVGITCARPLIGLLKLDNILLVESAVIAFKVAAIGTALSFLGNFIGGVIQGLQTNIMIGVIILAGMIADPIVRVVLLFNGWGIESFAWGLVANGSVLFIGAFIVLLHRLLKAPQAFSFSFGEMRNIASLSLFTGFGKIGGILSNNIRAFLITRYISPEMTTVFEVTHRPIHICRTLLDGPASFLLPSFSHLSGEGDTEKLSFYAVEYCRISLFSLLIIAGALILALKDFVTLWMGAEFYIGNPVAFILIGGLAIALIQNTSRLMLYAVGQIKYTGIVSLVINLVGVAISIPLIIHFGVIGLCLSPIIIFVILGVWLAPRRFYKLYLKDKSKCYSLVKDAFLCALAVTSSLLLTSSLMSMLNVTSHLALLFIKAAIYVLLAGGILMAFSSSARGYLSLLYKSLRKRRVFKK